MPHTSKKGIHTHNSGFTAGEGEDWRNLFFINLHTFTVSSDGVDQHEELFWPIRDWKDKNLHEFLPNVKVMVDTTKLSSVLTWR